MEVSGQFHIQAAFTRLPTEYEAECAPQGFWTLERRYESLSSGGIRTPNLPAHNLVNITTTVFGLQLRGYRRQFESELVAT